MAVSSRPRPGRPAGSRSFDPRSAAAFGDVVRDARQRAGISQETLAAMSEIDRSYFSRIERGLSQPTLFAVLKIAGALDINASLLVSRTERVLQRAQAASRQ
jgi:XRE family transcriptional regulator, regulator of sulfur utilization